MARDGERGRGDWKARRGSRDSGPYADSSGDPESGNTGPVDIMAVRRDDALIEAIAGDGPVTTDSSEEYQLAALLANWRAEIIEPPLPAGPDLDAIVAAVNQEIGARQSRIGGARRGNLRLVRPLLGAAAAVAVIAGGTTAFSYSAQPGDPLWRVKEVVFSEQAQTTIAQHADDDLTKAQDFIAQNRPEQAKALLQSASSTATQVSDDGRKSDLLEKYNDLLVKLQALGPGAAAGLTPAVPPRQTVPGSQPPTSGSEQPVTPGGGPGRPTYDPRYAPQSSGSGPESPGGDHNGPGRLDGPSPESGGPIVPPGHTTVVSPPSEPSSPGNHEPGGHESGGSHEPGGTGSGPDGGTPAGPSTIATPGESGPDKPGAGEGIGGGGAPGGDPTPAPNTPAPNTPVKPVAPSGDDPHIHPTMPPVAPTTVLLPPIGGTGLGGIK
ncbi:anti-sigma-D factor RsdA [Nocardia sp. alder85J]|uniref:anti-sigma-D factor RsdA n=1 Tax=Nocardia sp. alder85J TaxID=2862949 RepID=UPI001CD60404|nr:anti-sigma-D factor RsdA [Nocardia sp. alder85J]MCX4097192.1 anti-sigma-D factor RsdA [Nocardia sp. alder85J]